MIVPYFEPEITAIVHLMSDLAYDFEKYGAKVTVITGFPLRGTSEEVINQYIDKNEEKISENITIYRVGSKKREGTNFFVRGLKYISKTYSLYKKAKTIPTDIYYIYSTPPIMGLAGCFLTKKSPTVYSLQDIFPDNLLAKKHIKENNIIVKFLRSLEKYIYKNNTHIVTISRDMKENLIEKNVKQNKISVIGNWIDTNKIKFIPREKNHLFTEFDLNQEGFYVSYSGNLGYAQDIDIILESAKITQSCEPEIQYIIVGNGIYEDEIKQKIENENLKNIKLFPIQQEKYTSYVYSIGDVGLVTLKENLHGYAMPSKTWSMMAASQPIICTTVEKTQLYEIIRGTQSGLTVKPGDSTELANQILNLYRNIDELKKYGKNGRAYVEKNLSREIATKKYFDLMVDLINLRGN
jgi:glycosyltransferase involved in cell wall biosynthesis